MGDACFFAYELIPECIEAKEKENENLGFKEWLFQMSDMLFKNYYKAIMGNQAFACNSKEIYYLSIEDESVNALNKSRCCREIVSKIDRLPTLQRIPLCLHIAGYKHKEIAYKLSLPIGVIKTLIKEASSALEN